MVGAVVVVVCVVGAVVVVAAVVVVVATVEVVVPFVYFIERTDTIRKIHKFKLGQQARACKFTFAAMMYTNYGMTGNFVRIFQKELKKLIL